jgi:hypothetical protein
MVYCLSILIVNTVSTIFINIFNYGRKFLFSYIVLNTDENSFVINYISVCLEHLPDPISPKVFSTKKHFVCPFKGCSNRCPGDHHTDHCLTFSILTHALEHHHCGTPCTKCDTCGKCFSKLCRCHKCGSSSCEKCCYK